MPTTSAVTLVAVARVKAAKRLELECLKLDSYLPEPGGAEDVVVGTPQSGPVIRSAADCLLMPAHMDLLMSLRLIHDRTDKLCLW